MAVATNLYDKFPVGSGLRAPGSETMPPAPNPQPRAALQPSPQPRAQSSGTQKSFTVAEVVSRIRGAVEAQFPAAIWVEGQLSNCSYPASRHIYFDLVDEKVTDRRGQRILLPCAFFYPLNASLKFKLENGLKVLCYGEVTTYEAKGEYQLRVHRIEPKGTGALQLAFEQLKKRLQAEGLFEQARKRAIPQWPERVGLVTSPTGSVIHDMLVQLRHRTHVIILPVKVQGAGAAEEIAAAIQLANAHRVADVLIVGRGGGSLEELWAFNEECVARAIYHSTIPIISAVGHEDHWTIADYVADLRAPTPTDAAKTLAHERKLLMQQVRETASRLLDAVRSFLDDQATTLATLSSNLRLLHPINQLDRCLTRTQELHGRLIQAARVALNRQEQHLQGLAGRLQALSPLAVLARGYSITLKLPDRHVVTIAKAVHAGDELETLVAKGRIVSSVTRVLAEAQPEPNGPTTYAGPARSEAPNAQT